jgi:hypothetical protein
MKKIIILTTLFLSVACSTSKPVVRPQLDCWNEKNAKSVYDKLLTILNATEAELVEESCHKRKYIVGDRMIILVNLPDGVVKGRTYNEAQDPKQCLARGLETIKSYDSSIYNKILEKHQKLYPHEWSDPDLSPVSWLDCAGTQAAFDFSVTVFLHELTHQLADEKKQCIYMAVAQKDLCFDFPKDLPPRSYGKLGHFPTMNQEVLTVLNNLQKLYLGDIDQPFLTLLDELNTYTLSNENYLALLKKWGDKRLFDYDGKRPAIFSTIFYKLTMNYLSRLEKEHTKLFNKTFRENKLNQKAILELAQICARIYQEWGEELKKNQRSQRDWERTLFEEAVALQKKIYGN